MKFIETPLRGAYVIELEPLFDERGFFARTYCQREFAAVGLHQPIVQMNHSMTKQKGSIRGLHYQRPPADEAKIIRCVQGKVFDVMVDLRARSITFKRWYSVELSKDNMCMVYIPAGFAHGFQAITDEVEMIYYHSAFYNPEHEQGLRFDDPALMIRWPMPVSVISPKDRNYPLIDNTFNGINS
jgi:dTDP-4-dehydrorhamnose 3,5-epimerase